MDKHPLLLINNGLAIVSAKKGKHYNGLIVHAAFQLDADGPAVLIAINRSNLTHEYIESCRSFTLSILEKEAPMSLINLFGFRTGREVDKFAGVEYELGKNGLPYVLDNALAYIEAHVIHTFHVNPVTLFLGRVAESRLLKEGEPLSLYHYHFVKKGAFPRTSPLYFLDTLYFG